MIVEYPTDERRMFSSSFEGGDEGSIVHLQVDVDGVSYKDGILNTCQNGVVTVVHDCDCPLKRRRECSWKHHRKILGSVIVCKNSDVQNDVEIDREEIENNF